MDDQYNVYVKVDSANNIIAVNSDAFITPDDSWIHIATGTGYRFKHAQNNYFGSHIRSRAGIPLYRCQDGVINKRDPALVESEERALAAKLGIDVIDFYI